MKSEYRALVLTLTLLIAVPLLFGIGDQLGHPRIAITLCVVVSVAAWAYARPGDPKPPAAGGV